LTNDVLKTLKREVHKCFEGAAVSTGCKLKITEKMNYKSINFPLPANLTLDLNINVPLAARYESYASDLGIKFPSKRDQEGQSIASTDQGNVTYEIPAIHAVYKIDTPPGVGNHTPGFADVLIPRGLLG
jgi:metal-dependent amidase/aminoacylase/carboxypeptidase family protein